MEDDTKEKRRNKRPDPRQKEFVKWAVLGVPQGKAAALAGYSDPDAQASKLMTRPEVRDSIRAQQLRRIEQNLLPQSVSAVEMILNDKGAKHSDLITAAKAVWSYTLGKDAPALDKAPEDLTPGEIAQRMAVLRLRQLELAQEANTIEGTASKPPENDVFG